VDSDLVFHLISALAFLAGAAWFAAADQALDDANPQLLDDAGKPSAADQVRRPGHFRPPCRLLRIFATLALGAALASLLGDVLGSIVWGVLLLVLVAPVVMILAQAAPRAYGRAHPEAVMIWVSPTVTIAALIVGPLARLGEALGRGLVVEGPDGAEISGEEQTPDRAELLDLAEQAVAHGALTDDDAARLRGVLDLPEVSVREVMTPSAALTTLTVDAELTGAIERVIASGHVILPLLGVDGHIEGVVHLADLAGAMAAGETEATMLSLASPALAVPESAHLDRVLAQLQDAHTELALVLDEYGQLAGLVTVEDIIEEIVGEIESGRTRSVHSRTHGMLEVAGHLPLADLADHDIALLHPRITSVGGLVAHLLGRVAGVGDRVEVDSWQLLVTATEGARITRVAITRATRPM